MAFPSNKDMVGYEPYIDFTITPGGTQYEADVIVQMKKSDGENDEAVYRLQAWTSSDQTGATSVDTASGAHTVGGTGYYAGFFDADEDVTVLTDVHGNCTITITDTSTSALYLAVEDPRTGRINVSRVLAAADYAAA